MWHTPMQVISIAVSHSLGEMIFTLIVWTRRYKAKQRWSVARSHLCAAAAKLQTHNKVTHYDTKPPARARAAAAPVRLSETAAPAVDAKPPSPSPRATGRHLLIGLSRRRRFLSSSWHDLFWRIFGSVLGLLSAFFRALVVGATVVIVESRRPPRPPPCAPPSRAARRACPRGGRRHQLAALAAPSPLVARCARRRLWRPICSP